MNQQTDGMLLSSTGVAWDEERLAGRYAFFRKLRDKVSLRLIYYPYWLMEPHGTATWRFFGTKPVAMLMVTDARSRRCLRISAPPLLKEERLLPAEASEKTPFFPAVLENESFSLKVQAHIAPALYEEESAKRQAEDFALKAWNRKCNLPLGPRAALACTDIAATFLYKPFWLMTTEEKTQDGRDKLFIFDASTGIGGLSEYWNVAEYAMALPGGVSAS